MMTTKVTSADAGCWIDGHWGVYGVSRLISIAESYGYVTDEDDLDVMGEAIYDFADEVEAWMNENVAPDGFSFGWHDGEWFLQSTEWWESETF